MGPHCHIVDSVAHLAYATYKQLMPGSARFVLSKQAVLGGSTAGLLGKQKFARAGASVVPSANRTLWLDVAGLTDLAARKKDQEDPRSLAPTLPATLPAVGRHMSRFRRLATMLAVQQFVSKLMNPLGPSLEEAYEHNQERNES